LNEPIKEWKEWFNDKIKWVMRKNCAVALKSFDDRENLLNEV